MWKLLTGVLADQIHGHLDQKKLLPEEQKGCRKRPRGTPMIRVVVKSGKKDLAMAFFFNWKSPHKRLNSHYEAWSYKKKSTKKITGYRKYV